MIVLCEGVSRGYAVLGNSDFKLRRGIILDCGSFWQENREAVVQTIHPPGAEGTAGQEVSEVGQGFFLGHWMLSK